MCRVSAFRRDMRGEADEGAASAQHGERRDGTERRGGVLMFTKKWSE